MKQRCLHHEYIAVEFVYRKSMLCGNLVFVGVIPHADSSMSLQNTRVSEALPGSAVVDDIHSLYDVISCEDIEFYLSAGRTENVSFPDSSCSRKLTRLQISQANKCHHHNTSTSAQICIMKSVNSNPLHAAQTS